MPFKTVTDDFVENQNKAIQEAVPLAIQKFQIDTANAKWNQQMQAKQKEFQVKTGMGLLKDGYDNNDISMMNAGRDMVGSVVGAKLPPLDDSILIPKRQKEIAEAAQKMTELQTKQSIKKQIDDETSANGGKPLSPRRILEIHAGAGQTDAAKDLLSDENKGQTEEQLTSRSLKGDPEAQKILDAMQRRKIDIAKNTKAATVNIQPQGGGGKGDPDNFANWSEDEKKKSYESKLFLNDEPKFGLSAKNPSRMAYYHGYNQFLKDNNITAQDIAEGRAQAKYKQSTSATNTLALLNGVQPLFDEAIKVYKKFAPSYEGVGASALNWANMPFQRFVKNNPDATEFVARRNGLLKETERALTSTGAMSDTRVAMDFEAMKNANTPSQMESAFNGLKSTLKQRGEGIEKGPYSKTTQKILGGKKDNSTGSDTDNWKNYK